MPSNLQQLRTRARFEAVIGLAAPLLDLVLATGERVSRLAGGDEEPLPIPPASDRLELAAGRGPSAQSD